MTEEVEMDDLSLADSLEAAFDRYEEPEEIEARGQDEDDTQPLGDEVETTQRDRDEKGRFSKKSEETGDQPVEPVAATAEQPDAPETEPVAESLHAPQSWKATAREDWGNLPRNIQEEVLRRESDFNRMMQETAYSRKTGDALLKAAQPYEQMIRSEGSDPVRAAENMFRTASILKTGTQQQKAQTLTEIIKTYGVDINVLDQVLSGQAPMQAQQQPPQPQVYHDPRVDQMLARIREQEERQKYMASEKANQSVSQFARDHEFFEDVREEMADIIEIAARRGVEISLDTAYNKAINLNPEISKVVEQRQRMQNAQSTARSRNAASSVRSNPVSGHAAPPDTLRGALEEAINASR